MAKLLQRIETHKYRKKQEFDFEYGNSFILDLN